MTKIVQCVPNISEGRDLQKIETIVKPLKNQKGFSLISVEPDQDYNRTVITLIGDPEAMIEPLVLFFEQAKMHIDMHQHQGEHPRMGAVDVVPFIPISNIKMEMCIDYAHTLAKRVHETLDIPVYMYADAANHESRVKLPNIRKGEFEGMKEKTQDPFWKPDYGNLCHDTFGVVAIGARMPLIAYNMDLSTADQKIASTIAKAIRASSGGFQYIQAGPAFLEEKGFVQVTMNILDYKKNPIYRVFQTVMMEAKRYQVDILSSEVVGLVPKEALVLSIVYYESVEGIKSTLDMSLDEIVLKAQKYLKLRDFSKEKLIEFYV